MTSKHQPLEELPPRDNTQHELSALPPKNLYFNSGQLAGQPWPERPRILNLTQTNGKKEHVALPELNVPLQEVFYAQNRTLTFSKVLSDLITLKLHESMDRVRKSKEAGGLPYFAKRAQLKYRQVIKNNRPSMDPIQLPFSEKRPNSIANIQFPECILEQQDVTWDTGGKRLRLSAPATENLIESAVLWINENHWILNSFKYLSCAPKEKLPRDRRDSYKGINILLQHITNGRWIWITSLKPIDLRTYVLAAKKQPGPQEEPEPRVHINIPQTAALHDARMAFFAFRTADPKAALRQFCEQRTIGLKILKHLLDRLPLKILLLNHQNAQIMQNVGKRLPAQMEKYWKIQSIDPDELEELIQSSSAPNPHRLSAFFRPSLRRIRTDPEELRMASKRLSIEKETPRCPLKMCTDLTDCPIQTFLVRKREVKTMVRTALLRYLREKSYHEATCYVCFWPDPKDCAFHSLKKNLPSIKNEKRKATCSRCSMLSIRKRAKEIALRDAKLGLRPADFEKPATKEIILYWEQEHQADAPNGWCCHGEEPCNNVCMEQHRNCDCPDGAKCKVVKFGYGVYMWLNPHNVLQEVAGHSTRELKSYRRKFVPLVGNGGIVRAGEECMEAGKSAEISQQNDEAMNTAETPETNEPIQETSSTQPGVSDADADEGLKKVVKWWTRSRKNAASGPSANNLQTRVQQLRPVTLR